MIASECPTLSRALRDDRRAGLGVRPEDLNLATGGPGGGPQTLDAEVTVTEPLGDSLLLHCSIGETPCKIQAQPRTEVRAGDAVSVAYDPARLHLFDAETGEAFYHSERRIEAEDESGAEGEFEAEDRTAPGTRE